MITIQVSEKMRADLQLIFNAQVVSLGNSLRTWLKYASANKRNDYRARFDRAVDFLHALNVVEATPLAPPPPLPSDHPRFNQPLHLGADFDPRASDPHCVHGRRFSESCDLCAAPVQGVEPFDSVTASGSNGAA